MKLIPLPVAHLDGVWPLIAPYVRQMADRMADDWPEHEIRRAAVEREIILWLVWEETEKKEYGLVASCVGRKPSGKRVLVVEIAAGHDADRWVHCIAELEAFGRMNGCERMMIRGRAGWARLMPDYKLEREPLLTKEL